MTSYAADEPPARERRPRPAGLLVEEVAEEYQQLRRPRAPDIRVDDGRPFLDHPLFDPALELSQFLAPRCLIGLHHFP